jgi:transcriptional regulator with XRE-family HTH domain
VTTLAEQLCREREARGWTRRRAAAMCGLSQRGYEYIEDGYRRDTSLIALKQIAQGFGMLVAVLPDGSVRLERVGEIGALILRDREAS